MAVMQGGGAAAGGWVRREAGAWYAGVDAEGDAGTGLGEGIWRCWWAGMFGE